MQVAHPAPLSERPSRRESWAFALALALLIAALLRESLLGGKVLSPADVVFAQKAWSAAGVEPSNRLLMDPVLQFEPWLELSRAAVRRGELPLWNPLAGCGAPLLANGQSAVFDPFHLIAYLGPWPGSLAWIAAARLFVAGFGMFRLARAWGLGRNGRWFAGLAFPLTGFLQLWLLFPLASVAAWMPWLFLAIERLRHRPDARGILRASMAVAFVLLGGHIQTSVHVLLAAALHVGVIRLLRPPPTRFLLTCTASLTLGCGLAVPALLPLGDYLTRSPTWTDRQAEFDGDDGAQPIRWREAACWAAPYLYGSQRAGQPNLARALGVENLNESASGFAGAATLFLLAPLGVWSRWRTPVVRFLLLLLILGTLGALRIPPAETLLRALPVLDVMDHRRLGLWVAFALVALGGIGLDRAAASPPPRIALAWIAAWSIGALLLITAALVLPTLEPQLRARATAHYADPEKQLTEIESARRIDRQVEGFVRFLPAYYARVGGQVLLLSGAATLVVVRRRPNDRLKGFAALTACLDLFQFADGLNPAIPRAHFRPESPLIGRLHAGLSPTERALGIGEELPPNLLPRHGIADIRNYDSIELDANLEPFDPLFEPEPDRPARTSRRTIGWLGILRAEALLRRAGVRAVVAATDPPAELFDRVERIGDLRIGWWNRTVPPPPAVRVDGTFTFRPTDRELGRSTVVSVTYEPGWHAFADGQPISVRRAGPFLAVTPPAGCSTIEFAYRPAAVRFGLAIGGASLGFWLVVAGLAARKFGPMSLGAVRKVGLESIPAIRRTRGTRPAPSSGG